MLLAGLIILYAPMLADFGARFLWNEEDSHAGILLLAILWAYWLERDRFDWRAGRGEFAIGAAIAATGLLVYVVGRTTFFLQLQGFSLPVVVLGLTLATAGAACARRWWLLNLLLIFTVPVMGPFGDSFLVPLRLWLTELGAHFVSLLGYPAAASGVIVSVGFVDLNIAGACVGLRSMVSLTAIGLLFLHLFPPRSLLAGALFVCLLPVIALGANFLRLITLIVVAGQFGTVAESRIHDLAAFLEVGVAISLFILTARLFEKRKVSA